MSGIQTSRIYYINSQNRISGSDSNFSYLIPIDDQYTHVCVLQASIPMSFYLVRNGYNTFILNEKGTDILVTIPEGNYNYNNFMTTFKNALNNASLNHWSYDITFNNQTAKYTYNVTNNDAQPSFQFNNHLSQQSGFQEGTLYTFSNNILESVNVLNFIPESTIFIQSDIVLNQDKSILQEIYSNNTIPLSNIVYNLSTNVQTYAKKLKTNASNIFHFSINDEKANELYLNGQAVLITLLLYKEDITGDMIKKYIKYRLMDLNK